MTDERHLITSKMAEALPRLTRRNLTFLHVTPPQPCPYLPHRLERKLIAVLSGPNAEAQYDDMLEAGFRRSHTTSYRPACSSCDACVSARVCVDNYRPTRSHRRVLARNSGTIFRIMPALARPDHFALFRRYIDVRHEESEMATMQIADYTSLVEESFADSHVAEFRQVDGRLYGVCIFDNVRDGISAVYSFFEPTLGKNSPGTYMILRLIAETQNRKMPHLYLGYWIKECEKMTYKTQFRPIEILRSEGWTVLTE